MGEGGGSGSMLGSPARWVGGNRSPGPGAPSGCVKLYLEPKKLCKFFKKHAKGTHRLLQRACVLCRPGEEKDIEKGCKQLYNSPKNWVRRFDASVEALCPGTKAVTA